MAGRFWALGISGRVGQSNWPTGSLLCLLLPGPWAQRRLGHPQPKLQWPMPWVAPPLGGSRPGPSQGP
eukprot:264259-Lingulodinium_polyedra.AAC.1